MTDTVVNSIVGWIPTYVIDPIRVRFRVLRNLKANIGELEAAKEKLAGRRKDEQVKVDEAKKQEGVEASADAVRLFCQADKAVSDATNLHTEYEQRRGPFSYCLCWSGYQLSKRASKLKQDVENLYGEEPRSGWTTTAASTSQKGKKLDTVSIEGQTRREKLKQEIIDAVVDDRYVVVGLYGMGGIGKTTLLRHVYEHFRQTEHFESVIFTTVSATPNFSEIRKEIAESLGLDLKEAQLDDNDLKTKLCRLLERRKYMFILDDMWEPITYFSEICIPTPKKDNGCKILTASRSKEVVTRFATSFGPKRSLQLISVGNLEPGEAWNLFVEKVGEDITSKPAIKPLAEKVVKKCDGLPLAIVVIGCTMSTQETEGEWKDAVRELEESVSKVEGVEEKVFSKLKFSFEKLEPIQQSLFLYCCLFPDDYRIHKDELLNFVIGEETLCDEMQKLEEMRNKVDALVGKLLNSSMLEDGGNERVKMHDMMRDFGLWIASPTSSNYHISKPLAEKPKAPDAKDWCRATKIFLDMDYLPPVLPDHCPQLHTLFLRDFTGSKEIPKVNFLEQMPALGILDLSYCQGVKKLPSSIAVKLRVLCLSHCRNLQELPSEIEKLDQLISLDLSGCESLRKLPVGMKNLKKLRRLDISYAKNLKRIPSGVLSEMHMLESFLAHKSGLKFYTQGIMELSQLTSISNLEVEIKKVKDFHWLKPLLAKLITCHISLWNCTIDPSVLTDLLLEDSPNFDRSMNFMSCEGLTLLPTHGWRKLTVRRCPDLKTILNVEKEAKKRMNAFENLDHLCLDRLDQLVTLCSGVPQQPGCFSNLTLIRIVACPNLMVLFTTGVIRLLKKLKWLVVLRCPKLVNLIVSDDDDDDDDLELINAFPSLKLMNLCELPELKAICSNHHLLDLMQWTSLSIAHVYLCPQLRSPFFGDQRGDINLDDERDRKMTKHYLEQQKEVHKSNKTK
ncbi:probable disease resistance protein At1g61300 [Macadamia integrifolia]|uniref:probable disease resistance protein At1g61300 n=1 Tax=Macadamia integrifolia TaxID=60698 RepID=UPI001C4F8430|nr:probable disease resistance protein At1g61300 [Macadamia integrifolia]